MYNPGLTLALAFAAGMLAQTIAHHIKIPGIILLLATGVILGPDVVNIIQPSSLGSALTIIVGFSVAVILFEGGMNLRISRIKRERRAIQHLITIGAIVTAVGAFISVKLFLNWEWRSALLFSTLIIVTGPTVITPLLKRLKLKLSVSTILEAEGVLLDAIGAIIAAVTLEIVLSPEHLDFGKGFLYIIFRLAIGIALGIVSGFIIAKMLKYKNLIPEGLENVFTLSMIFAIYQVSNYLTHESGIVAVTIAGLVVGNHEIQGHQDLRNFKESITVMLIGMLFVLLAADVRLAEIQALGVGAIYVVAILILIVRPLSIFASTVGTNLNFKEKVLLSSFAPRGIVAAAIASLFAIELNKNGYDGSQLRAMVFVVITVTVTLTGNTSGILAKFLGLRRKSNNGWVILGAHEIGRLLAKTLHDVGEEVICIDSDPKNCQLAETEGIKIINNNGLEDTTLLRAEIDTRKGIICLTDNDEVNYLVSQKAKELGKIQKIMINIKQEKGGITEEMIKELDATIPFAFPRDLEQWNTWIKHEKTDTLKFKYNRDVELEGDEKYFNDDTKRLVLPLACLKRNTVHPVDNKSNFSKGCTVIFLINNSRIDEAKEWFIKNNWIPAQ